MGVSLLHNAGPLQNTLLVAGQREFEDLAAELVSTERGRKFLGKLRVSLEKGGMRGARRRKTVQNASECWGGLKAGDTGGSGVLPLFDTEQITKDLNQAFMLMSDAHELLWKDRDPGAPGKREVVRLPHIVLTGRNVGGLDAE